MEQESNHSKSKIVIEAKPGNLNSLNFNSSHFTKILTPQYRYPNWIFGEDIPLCYVTTQQQINAVKHNTLL